MAAGESPELIAAALQLAQDADASARADGYRLLAEFNTREEVYTLARRALMEEHDPAALAGALMCLQAEGPACNEVAASPGVFNRRVFGAFEVRDVRNGVRVN